ncbi:MAG: hypothetical protein A2Y02_02740 [Omnitrophica bacterium GWA2_52_12]|nr:MAG: hypothetical protein A2Y02_02740 [Omnitrophica bacterium GWA2_52_12]
MKTILLIDDEADLVFMLQGILTREGYHVVTARNGEEGLAKLKEAVPHLIILDMNMPKMGGIAFYHAIANLSDGKARYPVLVLTARANLEKLFKDLCVDGFMAKPFEIDDLLKEIKTILCKRYERGGAETKRDPGKPVKVLIIENNQEVLGQMVLAFATHGYLVSGTQSGAAGIERAAQDPPDLMLIKLGLPDLSGEATASILKQMPKTMDIPLILYTPPGERPKDASIQKICEKAKVKNLVESNDPALFLEKVEVFFRNESIRSHL